MTVGQENETDRDANRQGLASKLASGSSIALVGLAFDRLLRFGFRVGLGQLLGPAQYGLFALGWAVTGIGRALGLLGLQKAIVRFVPMYEKEGKTEKVVGVLLVSFASASVASVLLAGTGWASAEYVVRAMGWPSSFVPVFRQFAVVLPFWVVIVLAAAVAQAYGRIAYQQLIKGLRVLFGATVVLGLLSTGFDLSTSLTGYAISHAIVAAVGLGVVFWLSPPFTTPTVEPRRVLGFSLPLFMSGLAYLLLNRMDQMFLGAYRGPAVVGVYNAAALVAGQLMVFFLATNAAFEPTISTLHDDGEIERLGANLKRVSRWLIVSTMPTAAVTVALSPQLLGIFGPAFETGKYVLIILLTYYVLRVSVGPTGEILQMSGHQRLVLLDSGLVVFVNAGLNLLLIPPFGGIGAALATTVSISLVELLALGQVYYLFGIHPFSRTNAVGFASGLALCSSVAALQLLDYRLKAIVPFTAVGVALFFVVAWTYALNDSDKTQIRKIVSRLLSSS